jgi:hypothetical protein
LKPAAKPAAKIESRPQAAPDALNATVRHHLKLGWWALLLFLTFGIVLEALHAFKNGYYLNTTNQTRRFMWTLAHAHGTLLALINLAFAATVPLLNFTPKGRKLASILLSSATVLMPAGFFLGGLVFYGGDPGLGILLLPLGAVFLLIAVFLAARATRVQG